MAIINAADYDHIDVVNGADTNRHMLKDAQARQDVADLKSAIQHKTDNKYGGEEVSNFVTLQNQKTWYASSGVIVTTSNRACAAPVQKTPDMLRIDCASGYGVSLFANNEGIGHPLESVDLNWRQTIDLTDVNYTWLFIVARKSDNTDFDAGTSADVCSIVKYSEVIPYLTGEDLEGIEMSIDDLDLSIDDLDFLTTESKTYINRAETASNSNYANTKRWFLTDVIPAKTIINTFSFYCRAVTSSSLTVEIWELVNSTLTKKKSISFNDFAAGTVRNVPIEYKAEKPTMISFLATNTVVYIAGTDISTYAVADMVSDTLQLSNLELFAGYAPSVSIICTVPSDSENVTPNVITIGEGMDFEEIQDAINSITDDSVTNPYTLLLMSKGTPYKPFSTLRRSFDVSYPWNSITPRYISIIGIDKAHCIIRSDSGNYKKPCGEPMLNGMIKNITFIMTNDEQDASATQGGYCLHIDCRTLNDAGYNMMIEDCDFEDESGPCLGIGLHKNCTLTIRRCNFKTTLSADYAPHEGYTNLYNYGVIFCHTSTLADATEQRINIEDCSGVCTEGNKSLWISVAGDYDPETASFYYKLLRNVFWNTAQNAPSYNISASLTPDPMNFGNNDA